LDISHFVQRKSYRVLIPKTGLKQLVGRLHLVSGVQKSEVGGESLTNLDRIGHYRQRITFSSVIE
jgi:hypothetical protein